MATCPYRLRGASKSGATPCQKLRVNFGTGGSSWTLAGCARDLSRQKLNTPVPHCRNDGAPPALMATDRR
jgi:hypothetical protein